MIRDVKSAPPKGMRLIAALQIPGYNVLFFGSK